MCDSSWLVLLQGNVCYNCIYHREGERFMAVRLRIREVAKEQGIGMGKLQRMSDVAYNTVRRIFKDPYYITTTDTLGQLPRALTVPPCTLIDSGPDAEST